jgi:hypothetical protein
VAIQAPKPIMNVSDEEGCEFAFEPPAALDARKPIAQEVSQATGPPAPPEKPSPPILRDELTKPVQAEDFLPFFVIPSGAGLPSSTSTLKQSK